MPQLLIYHPPPSHHEMRLIEGLVDHLNAGGIMAFTCCWHEHPKFARVPTGLNGLFSVRRRQWRRVASIEHLWPELHWRESMFNPSNLAVPKQDLLRRAENIAAFQSWLLDSIRPQTVVFWGGERTQQFLLRELLAERRIPELRLERAPFPGLVYLSEDGLMADSSMATAPISWNREDLRANWLAKFRAYRSRVVSGNYTWWEQAPKSGSLRASLGVRPNQKIALFSAQVDGDTQNYLFSPFDGNVDAFDTFCRLCAQQEGVFVLGKHHPKSDVDPDRYRSILNIHSSLDGCWLTDGNLDECLAAADRVAAVNSSVLFEAALRGVPCLAMGRNLFSCREVFYDLRSPQDTDTVSDWLNSDGHVERQEHLEEAVAWLLSRFLFSVEDLGLRSVRDLADEITDRVTNADRTPPAPTLLPEQLRDHCAAFFKPRFRARLAKPLRDLARAAASRLPRGGNSSQNER